MNHEPRFLIHQFSNSLILSAFGVVNLGNIYLSNLFNLGNLWLKINQSKITNYAKQSQFLKKSNVYNRSFDNEVQLKMNNGHLVKTNPNKANFLYAVALARADSKWHKPPLTAGALAQGKREMGSCYFDKLRKKPERRELIRGRTSLLCVTAFAINGLTFLRLKRDFTFLSAFCTGSFKHLAWSKIFPWAAFAKISHDFSPNLHNKKCLEH